MIYLKTNKHPTSKRKLPE